MTDKLPASTGLTADQLGFTKDGDVRVYFAQALSTDDKAALDLFMSDRGYNQSSKPVTFHAPSSIVQSEIAITSDTDWQDLGGVVTSPNFFVPDLNRILGQVTGAGKVSGTGVELRIIEDNLNGTIRDMVPAPRAVADTADAWKSVQFTTQLPPSTGLNMYILQGRLNGATSASIRFVSMSLLEIL